ncbi:MAG: HrgA protein [Lautropia sp.]|nr:HrgA protein [Lautropia sp.]
MEQKLNLSRNISEHLRSHPQEKFTARELANWLFATHPAACLAKMKRSEAIKNNSELIQQLVAEIGSKYPGLQKHDPGLKTTEGRPRKYYYTPLSDRAEIEAAEATETATKPSSSEATQPSLNEHALYPKLAQYLHSERGLHAMRIDEKRAFNRRGPNGNRWLYPDVVALEDLGADWTREVSDCVEEHGAQRTRLWSFEVKLLINSSNVRECFFQTVSNSSWANFGYLVSAEIGGKETLTELRMLSAAHGIGFIHLDTDNPADSQIVLPARERDLIDWNLANRIASENSDFLNYIRLVWRFHRNRGSMNPREWNLHLEQD